MAFDYQEFVDLAKELIEEFGRTVALVRLPKNPPADTDKPWVSALETPTVEPVIMCFVPADVRSEPQQTNMAPKTVVHEQLQLCIVAAASLTSAPNLRDQIIDSDGSEWAIQTVNPLKPGATVIYYALSLE